MRAVVSQEEKEEFFYKKGMAAYVHFAKPIVLVYSMLMLAPFASLNNMVAFHKPFNYYEQPEAIYMRRSLDADQAFHPQGVSRL